MKRTAPAFRISLGLVTMTLGLLLAGHFLGLLPSEQEHRLRERQQFCESLAIQLSLTLRGGDPAQALPLMNALVQRNGKIQSAALRRNDGSLVSATGAHPLKNGALSESASTDFVEVPLYDRDGPWGSVEVSFAPLRSQSLIPFLDGSVVKLMLFIALLGLGLYYLLIRRALKHLDPSTVIPARVKATLDVLSEGVVLIDDTETIVLANTSFAEQSGFTAEALLGRTLSDLPWINHNSDGQIAHFAWSNAILNREAQTSRPLQLRVDDQTVKTFMINSAPILDNAGQVRGAIATFDNVTKLEQTNAQLEAMLQMLKDSQDKVHQKNQELQRLASIDPLTGCLNRRAFFERLDQEFDRASRSDAPLCCIMCDIDHFKPINDQHGHARGDQVIESVATVLRSVLREGDAIARYGGEEFCILLPGMSLEQAEEAAERLRHKIEQTRFEDLGVTASFGLTCSAAGARSPKQLLRQADTALYQAKGQGRNRVVVWESPEPVGQR